MLRNLSGKWLAGGVLVLAPLVLVLAGVGGSPQAVYVVGEDDGDDNLIFTTVGDDNTAFLGVSTEEETEHEEGGARVDYVVDDSPAEEAGIEKGDIIISFDGATVRGPVGLTKKIHAREPGDEAVVVVLRDGKRHEFTVELGKRSDSWSIIAPGLEGLAGTIRIPEIDAGKFRVLAEDLAEAGEGLGGLLGGTYVFGDCDEDDEDCEHRNQFFSTYVWTGRPTLGVQLVEVTPELREHLGGEEKVGVLVSKVLDGTPADKAGIRVGDLIIAVDGETVKNSSTLRKALHGKTGETFPVEVIRDRTPLSIEVTIPEPDDDVPTGPRAFFMPREKVQLLREVREAERVARAEARAQLREQLTRVREAEREARAERSAQARAARAQVRESLREAREQQRQQREQLLHELRELREERRRLPRERERLNLI